jgi:hypothetical protein
MNEQCPYLDGNLKFQCHLTKALPAARIAIGYEGFPIAEVKKDLCLNSDNRAELCPAFKDIWTVGQSSQFARLITNRF